MKHLRWIIPVVCVVSTVLTLFSCLVLPTNFGVDFDSFVEKIKGEWEYDNLPGDYSIVNTGGNLISLVKMTSEKGGPVVVSGYVAEFCCDGKYIAVKRAADASWPVGDFSAEPTYDINSIEYYIVDSSADGEKYGPYDRLGFIDKCNELSIEFEDWIKTYPCPNDDR